MIGRKRGKEEAPLSREAMLAKDKKETAQALKGVVFHMVVMDPANNGDISEQLKTGMRQLEPTPLSFAVRYPCISRLSERWCRHSLVDAPVSSGGG